MSATIPCDLAIVGGGLAGALIAMAVKARRPALDVRLIEAGSAIGGNHLWSFFTSDVAPRDRWLVAPLISHRWTRYDVAFPGHARTLATGYCSIESTQLDRVVRASLPAEAVMTGRAATLVTATQVELADGDRIEATGVIDCRGADDLSALDLGWQKFVGHEIALSAPHDQERPLVMDATIEQADGYRFVYALPFSATRIFVEDTYYSDGPELDEGALGARIAAYVAARSWQGAETVREERGVLPVVMGGDFERYWQAGGAGVAKAGVRAGLFHPLTSYSLPDAVRTASLVADAPWLDGTALHDRLHAHARHSWQARRFYRMLSAMLFKAAEPMERYRVLARFYRLDAGLIGRFYAAESTMADKIRVLSGRPPVPVGRAVQALWGMTK
jgi:lycopene beta-cyclase